jgi:hypothetical protein
VLAIRLLILFFRFSHIFFFSFVEPILQSFNGRGRSTPHPAPPTGSSLVSGCYLVPVLPALRCMYSSAYLTPLPL